MEWREVESLDARFANLEHQMRGVAVAWLVLIVVTALLQLWAVSALSAPPEVLKVRRVEILDGAGQRRLDLGLAPDGSPRVRLYDDQGIQRLGLSVTPERSGLTVFDAQGRQRVMLAAPK